MNKDKAPGREQVNETGIYTTSIRVSENLINRAKKYADKTGASVNSTICFLLDMGLKVVDEKTITYLSE